MNLTKGIYQFNSVDDMAKSLDEHEDLLNDYVFDKIKYNVENDNDEFILFLVYDQETHTNLNVTVSKSGYLKPLEKCLKKYENNQEYIKCANVKKIIDKLNEV